MATKTGKMLKKLEDLCIARNWNFCVCWQRMTGYTIEIYTGYVQSYKGIYYDEASSLYKAIKKGVQFIEKQEKNDNKRTTKSNSNNFT
ncbi:hypothetical protein AB4865_07735 [Capnocytophaga sp. ARDL2]|uniref:hypothetical protein n=1 Tax=Capnocytophaga sp. ARDL2 TaxID=3238809 RepID=UPI00355644F8